MTVFSPQRGEIFLRKSEGRNLMFCGMLNGPRFPGGGPNLPGSLSQSRDEISTLVSSGAEPLRFHEMQVPYSKDQWQEIDAHATADIGNAPTWQTWNRADPEKIGVLMQYVIRQVMGRSDLCMVAGIIQDPAGILPLALHEGELMVDASISTSGLLIDPESIRTTADMTCGNSLSQVLKNPVWRLGAEECWAPVWTVRGDIAEMGREANKLRDAILTGEAEPGDEERFNELVRRTDWTVIPIGRDRNFDAVLREISASGGYPETADPALETASEAGARSETMMQAVRRLRDDALLDL
ncbi:hypothetical protein ACEUZ9_000860 [Paracoccus litorisediminis]|uniref:hypothetical protein n=1 Tax=Paracoccus litorisediminis TaxID=2006130 RepID=UPI00372E639A